MIRTLGKCEALLDKVEDNVAEEIRNILVSNEHLKLSRRFAQFILKYLDDDYYKAIDKRQGSEEEVKQAVVKLIYLDPNMHMN